MHSCVIQQLPGFSLHSVAPAFSEGQFTDNCFLPKLTGQHFLFSWLFSAGKISVFGNHTFFLSLFPDKNMRRKYDGKEFQTAEFGTDKAVRPRLQPKLHLLFLSEKG